MGKKWKDKNWVKNYKKRYYQENEKILQAKRKIYYQQQVNRTRRRLREQTPKARAVQKKYYQTHKEELKSKAKMNYRNPKFKERKNIRDNEYQKKRRKNDPSYNTQYKIRTYFKKVMRTYSKTGKVMPIKKYDLNIYKIIKCLGEKPNDGKIYEVDHIVPASWFNHNNLKELKWAWAPENLQWLRTDINKWKSNRFILPLSVKDQKKWPKK